jgi:hypothetical protein
MPRVSQWFIRTAMMYLVVALALGAIMQTPFAARLPLFRALGPTYVHLPVVGWLTQLIFGVAYWMFPRYSAEQPRGSERLVSSALLQLLAGWMFVVNTWPRIRER